MRHSDILTISGRYFDFHSPHLSEFGIEDIAHALAHLCRFTGHTTHFYSVAQHSVLVSRIVPPEHALAGLMHDAPEAFIGDVSRPLKALLPDYRAIERRVEHAVLSRFGLFGVPPAVAHADLVLLATEQRDLLPAHGERWTCIAHVTPLARRIEPWSPPEAKAAFLARWRELDDITPGVKPDPDAPEHPLNA